jgi:hypothetical protein
MGMLGLVAGVFLAVAFFFILPWLAIVECVRSDRGSDVKTILVIGLVLTWSLGSFVYGLFLTRSRALRIFTVLAIVVPLLILVPSIVSLGTGVHMDSKIRSERERAETEDLLSRFRPGHISPDVLEPFSAIHFLHGNATPESASVVRFERGGPDFGTARDIDKRVKQVAVDPGGGRLFALTSHDFGTITPSTGRFTKIEVDPSLGGFSWPKGMAFDTAARRVIILTSHVTTHFYTYDPRTSDWQRLPSETRDLSLVGLTYLPDDDSLYALEYRPGDPALMAVRRFNTSGASLGTITLDPPIPVSRRHEGLFQVHASAGKLVVLLPPIGARAVDDGPFDSGANRIFVVDPSSGAVAEPRETESEGVI